VNNTKKNILCGTEIKLNFRIRNRRHSYADIFQNFSSEHSRRNL